MGKLPAEALVVVDMWSGLMLLGLPQDVPSRFFPRPEISSPIRNVRSMGIVSHEPQCGARAAMEKAFIVDWEDCPGRAYLRRCWAERKEASRRFSAKGQGSADGLQIPLSRSRAHAQLVAHYDHACCMKQARIMRTRLIVRIWSAEIFVHFLPGQLNGAEVAEMVRVAGESVGIGDWRLRHGRFTAETL